MLSTRLRVLACFKTLHKARKQVFSGDVEALNGCRIKINDQFRKNKDIMDATAIDELIKSAEETAQYLKATVVQARLNETTGNYQLQLTKDSVLLDNSSAKSSVSDADSTNCKLV